MTKAATAPAKSGTVGWITKEEAGKLLDKSERTILAMAADGRIQSKQERPEGGGQKVTLLHAGDVARLAEAPPSVQVARRPAADLQPPPQVDLQPTVSILAELVAGASQKAPAPRPWLTLEEAVASSGLTKRWLENLAKEVIEGAASGDLTPLAVRIPIRDMGKGSRGGRWRFHRESLEKA